MEQLPGYLRFDERTVMELRGLYEQAGYRKYRMNKFESYDLYAEYKPFLKGEHVLAFTDISGRLIALKPDVTISIAKNIKEPESGCEKLYYTENVYRVKSGDNGFSEMMQVGLENIGDINTYEISEVLILAEKSLSKISENRLLALSHQGFLEAFLSEVPPTLKEKLSQCIAAKNLHEIRTLCEKNMLPPDYCEKLARTADIYGPFETAIDEAEELCRGYIQAEQAVSELKEIYNIMKRTGYEKNLRLDFSIINDMDYYNGVLFQGFIDGIHSAVLYGGRYDRLIRRLGKRCGAVGFAVYTDLLDRLGWERSEYDTDVLIVYGEDDDPAAVAGLAEKLISQGESVAVQRSADGRIRAKRILKVSDGGVAE